MAYKILQQLTDDGQIFVNELMGTTEAMLPTGGFATAHAPTMTELSDGTLLLAWFAGSFEGGTDINIICSRLLKGADKWTDPVVVSNDPERSDQNPSLFCGPDNQVWAMYTSQKGRQEGVDNM